MVSTHENVEIHLGLTIQIEASSTSKSIIIIKVGDQ